MPSVSRGGDINTEGGSIIPGSSTVYVNGILVGLLGDTVTAHSPYGPPHPPHAAATIVSSSGTVFADGVLVAWVGSDNSCGHTIITGSDDVDVGS
jgi:uncharacterized Zn-binding protein involved in type VI secretion